ncbi:MAG: hypothetical protein RID53_00410 [Coleofasciculus sp. B1-GNL1-01]|uniref:hypothetical protein n=1 Tax=Coleofasciculus sp. B1-GNL1-01 TaxID=3068484 RepID=UPI0032F4D1D7
MKLLIGLLAAIVIFYISSLNWRHTVKAVLFILVVEGALRKWIFPQASDLIYFLKDFLLLGAYLSYFGFLKSTRQSRVKNLWINMLIFFVTGWCIFQAFNPSLGSLVVGIFGLRGYLLYIPLIWIIPNLFQSRGELEQFLRSHLLLVIPVGILGIAQFFSPPSSPINVYAPGDVADVATFGGGTGIVRVTGTFSYLSGFSVYLLVCFALLIPLVSLKQSRRWQSIYITELLLVVVNSFMTGSRGLIISEILFLFGYFGIRAFILPSGVVRLIKRFFVPILGISLAVTFWFQPAIEVFWMRTTSNQDLPERIQRNLTQPFEFFQYKALDGYGTGATHQATPALRAALDLPRGELIPTQFEGEMGKVSLEIGPIGFFLWYALRASLVVYLGLLVWKLKIPFLRQLALAAFLIHAINLRGQVVFNHTFSIYYWFLAGFIFLLPRLEQIESWQQYHQQFKFHGQIPNFPHSSNQ